MGTGSCGQLYRNINLEVVDYKEGVKGERDWYRELPRGPICWPNVVSSGASLKRKQTNG
ncbi:hypothetical protein Bpfe_018093, partial [Biomphalaria pfeifferi]